MCIHVYARIKPMTDVVGRVDYLTNPARQEHLLGVAGIQNVEYWSQLSEDSQAAWAEAGGNRTYVKTVKNKRTGMMEEKIVPKRACEGREVHLALPGQIVENMEEQERMQLAGRLSSYIQDRYGVDNLTVLHRSKTDMNYHAHILMSERLRFSKPIIHMASRTIWIDETGKRRRTKKELLDADGQMRPGCRSIKKGEVIREQWFGEKDSMMAEKEWLDGVKHDLATWINEELKPDLRREVFDPTGPYLAQEHIGKGRPDGQVDKIKRWNDDVKYFNSIVRDGRITERQAQDIKTQVMLSPDRAQGLKAALYMATLNKKPIDQGGARTAEGPEEERKRQLRELYRLAAEARRRMNMERESSLEWKRYRAEAREYSARIEAVKRELAYLMEEDCRRKLKLLEEERKRLRLWVNENRSRVCAASRRVERCKKKIREIEEELDNLPWWIIFSEREQQREEILEEMLVYAEKELVDAEEAEEQARRDYANSLAKRKREKARLKEEKRKVKEEKRKQAKRIKEARAYTKKRSRR